MNMRVLAVDDDPVILDLLQVILRQEGHETVVVRSGSAALDLLARSDERFDVLVLDITMPEMDGVELCGRIRNLPLYAHSPIIMLTAMSDSHSIETAFSAGANDYITKPFDVKGIGPRLQVAERMMAENRKALDVGPMVPNPLEMKGEHDIAFEDAALINGVNHHTDEFSLGNYLSTMEKHRVEQSSVFAAHICAFDRLYENCTKQELQVILKETWIAIAAAADHARFLGAYVGSGNFILITTSEIQDEWNGLELLIEANLACSEPLKKANLTSSVRVLLGRPFRPNASKTKRVKPTFDRARLLLQKRLEMESDAG
ncbi:response regulator [Sulfitobacter geojensis]|uniref:response regulator n=1 Tax=Sulfitobacter geojensis TaxID=1342299 RepID=UPI00248FC09E|nr:response regulator [Sulfitobacter geojensis]